MEGVCTGERDFAFAKFALEREAVVARDRMDGLFIHGFRIYVRWPRLARGY